MSGQRISSAELHSWLMQILKCIFLDSEKFPPHCVFCDNKNMTKDDAGLWRLPCAAHILQLSSVTCLVPGHKIVIIIHFKWYAVRSGAISRLDPKSELLICCIRCDPCCCCPAETLDQRHLEWQQNSDGNLKWSGNFLTWKKPTTPTLAHLCVSVCVWKIERTVERMIEMKRKLKMPNFLLFTIILFLDYLLLSTIFSLSNINIPV